MSADSGIGVNQAAREFFLEGVAEAPGSYKMEVEVSDGLDNSEKYTIELTINEPVAEVIFEDIDEIAEDLTEEVEEEVSNVPEIKPEPLTVTYKGITKKGEITLKFSQPMDVPENWSEILNPPEPDEGEEEDEGEGEGEEEEEEERRRLQE